MTSLDHSAELNPISPQDPIPHRKILRTWLIPLSQRSTLRAITMLIVDYAWFSAFIAATVWFQAWWVKALFGLAAGFVIGRLFIIGHDACHQSLTEHRTLNKWLGRIAFLPSITPYSLWDVGHNVIHHGFTNLKGKDFVWAPLTLEEFNQLSWLDRALYRAYRSGWAPGLYYMIEIWWKREFFPNRQYMQVQRPVFTYDSLLVSVFGLTWAAVVIAAAIQTQQSVLLVLFMGCLLPFMVWNTMIGFVVYVHHTHKQIKWFDDKMAWLESQPFVTGTVHLTFPFRIGNLMHHIMEHTAHHLDMGIPLYRLKEAQSKLEHMLPERIVIQPFSWRWYRETNRLCKLYDFQQGCWTAFSAQ